MLDSTMTDFTFLLDRCNYISPLSGTAAILPWRAQPATSLDQGQSEFAGTLILVFGVLYFKTCFGSGLRL